MEPNRSTVSRESPALIVAAFAVIYIVWGSTYLGIRIAIESFPPFAMAGLRFFVAGGLLYAVLRLRGVARPSAREWRDAAIIGFVMLGLGNGSVTWAEKTVASNVAALIIAAAPFFVVAIEWLRPGGKQPAAHVAGGALVGFSGMLWLMIGGSREGSTTTGIGVVTCLFSTLAWTSGMMYARYATKPRHLLLASAQQMLAGSASLILFSLLVGEWRLFPQLSPSMRSVSAFLYLSFIGSLLTFSVYGWLLRVAEPATVSTATLVNPVVAVILGWLVLGETLSPRAVAAAAVILIGVGMILLPPLFREQKSAVDG